LKIVGTWGTSKIFLKGGTSLKNEVKNTGRHHIKPKDMVLNPDK
jgi:hypothetical protein